MDLGLRGRVAIVAAASKGLGRAVAEESAREGAEIAIYARTPADLEAAAERIRLAGCRQVFWEALDVSDAAAITAFVASGERSFGRVDICVTIPAGLRLNCSWPPPRKVGAPGPTNC
jgi:3-oxoacyl-[acyl-carrier protein] reductase